MMTGSFLTPWFLLLPIGGVENSCCPMEHFLIIFRKDTITGLDPTPMSILFIHRSSRGCTRLESFSLIMKVQQLCLTFSSEVGRDFQYQPHAHSHLCSGPAVEPGGPTRLALPSWHLLLRSFPVSGFFVCVEYNQFSSKNVIVLKLK